MDGVAILTTYEKGLLTGYGYLGIMFTLALIFSLSVMLINNVKYDSPEAFFASVCVIASIICALCATVALIDAHTEYKIAVNDAVNFNDVVSRYEIISQDGKLLTVKELDVK